MVEDFKLPVGRLYVKNGKVFQYAIKMIFNYMGYPEEKAISKEIDLEKLRLWLEEATKPRYIVELKIDTYIIVDRENKEKYGEYYIRKGFDAKAEAEKLCKELNEKGR